MLNALSSVIDKNKVEEIVGKVDDNSRLVEEIVDKLVEHYSGELDRYMAQIDDVLTDQEVPPTDLQLDDFTLNLPSILYFTSEAQESLGIKEDVSNAIRNELYNMIRDKSDGTVADKNSRAELATQSEAIVAIAYKRAYRKVKLRVECAYEMLSAVKKVMTRRMGEVQISQMDRGRGQNE